MNEALAPYLTCVSGCFPGAVIKVLAVLGVVVPAAAWLANHVPPTGFWSKLLHWVAGNGPKIQAAILAAKKPTVPATSLAPPAAPLVLLLLAVGLGTGCVTLPSNPTRAQLCGWDQQSARVGGLVEAVGTAAASTGVAAELAKGDVPAWAIATTGAVGLVVAAAGGYWDLQQTGAASQDCAADPGPLAKALEMPPVTSPLNPATLPGK